MADSGVVVVVIRRVMAGVISDVINGNADHVRRAQPFRRDESESVGVDKGREEQVKHQHHQGDGLYGWTRRNHGGSRLVQ